MSDELILPNLEIQGFRAFRKLQIERLGRVNLIVGKNNVGKTSVLEALWLYANPSPRVLRELISARDEFDQPQGPRPNGSRSSPVPIGAIFHGRLADPGRTPLISIGPIGDKWRTLRLELTDQAPQSIPTGWTSTAPVDGNIPEGNRFLSRQIGDLPPKYFALSLGDEPIITLGIVESDVVTAPSVYVGSDGLDPPSTRRYWHNTTSTEHLDCITDSLRMIESRIARIDARDDASGKLVPIVLLEGSSEPITLRSMGEGMVRLFELALALVNSILPPAGGLLLVDEIESGLHYSVHEDLWTLVFKWARDLNVQVFATTHSWDCIEAFQRAACEDESSEGYLIRLGWRRDEIVATVYDEGDLAVVTRDHIEVR